MYFNAFLGHRQSVLECYLTVRKGETQAQRFFTKLRESVPGIQSAVHPELQYWEWQGRERLGFRLESVSVLRQEAEEESQFMQGVAWMREHLNILVSTLHPRLQRMLANERMTQ